MEERRSNCKRQRKKEAAKEVAVTTKIKQRKIKGRKRSNIRCINDHTVKGLTNIICERREKKILLSDTLDSSWDIKITSRYLRAQREEGGEGGS
jgi:hypothetical protein